MKNLLLLLAVIVLSTTAIVAQVENERYDSRFDSISQTTIDSLYLEDQFYIGFSFNLIVNKPTEFSQNGFSGGLHFGYIRDIPINKRRNIAFGAGLGLSVNTYSQNLAIAEGQQNNTSFTIVDRNELNISSNRFNTYLVEAPLEFRWRTSTPTESKFWRIYGGVRLGYIYYFRSNLKQPDNTVSQTDVPELNKFRAGATFTFGYNTFNFSFYYSLNPLFDASLDNSAEQIDLAPLKIGLMFYIL